jgi:hypothetical protein
VDDTKYLKTRYVLHRWYQFAKVTAELKMNIVKINSNVPHTERLIAENRLFAQAFDSIDALLEGERKRILDSGGDLNCEKVDDGV